ncbi:alpha/beta hydrolase [Rhizomonospora bruguierae]|uniref:alpha/beta hydrolase n=1 Tax=Rhizomonospora bruguierae TaxID=1581705 RepID=UPI001BCF1598|nr:phospholipase [Micromonospora sp. NBRC 107566]
MPITHESAPPHRLPEENSRHGRLTVRPGPTVTPTGRTGLVTFDGPGGEMIAQAYVPEPADGGLYRMALLLHGAGGSPRQALDLMLRVADERRLLLVAPQSSTATWDMITIGFGPDVRRIDRVVQEILDAYPVGTMVIGGFSDGASYALSLGLINGDLFEAVVAFSPGFAAPLITHGRPRLYVAHGTDDQVLPIDRCSRRIVPRLRSLNYDVTFDEFDDGHEVPDSVVTRVLDWLG